MNISFHIYKKFYTYEYMDGYVELMYKKLVILGNRTFNGKNYTDWRQELEKIFFKIYF